MFNLSTVSVGSAESCCREERLDENYIKADKESCRGWNNKLFADGFVGGILVLHGAGPTAQVVASSPTLSLFISDIIDDKDSISIVSHLFVSIIRGGDSDVEVQTPSRDDP